MWSILKVVPVCWITMTKNLQHLTPKVSRTRVIILPSKIFFEWHIYLSWDQYPTFFLLPLTFCWWAFLFQFLNFSFPEFIQFGFSSLILSPHLALEEFYLLPSIASVFMDFFKGLIHFLYKDLFYLHSSRFKVFVLCFSSAPILRAYCGRVAGLLKRCIVLVLFTLVCKHLGCGGS